MRKLTAERLRELLEYRPDEGLFYWRVNRGSRRVGAVAGCLENRGYLRIGIDGRSYLTSRLAWMYMVGEWPKGEVDHRDTNRTNNSWENLRVATHGLNRANTGLGKNNTSGYKGVSFRRDCGKWTAKIQKKFLGYFCSPEAAHAAYSAAANQCFGEYARAA